MNISMRKLKALCRKDLIDYLKNPAISIGSLMPILFVLLYRYLPLANVGENRSSFLLYLGMSVNMCMCGIMIASTSIAEEKEKFTLRTLMLSNVSAMEFFLSKTLVALLITILGNVVIFFLSGEKLSFIIPFLIVSLLGGLDVVVLSAVLGLLSRDQMSSGVIQVPVMLILLLPVTLAGFAKIFQFLSKITPLGASIQLYSRFQQQELATWKTFEAVAVLLIWLILAALAFVYFYRKKGVDH